MFLEILQSHTCPDVSVNFRKNNMLYETEASHCLETCTSEALSHQIEYLSKLYHPNLYNWFTIKPPRDYSIWSDHPQFRKFPSFLYAAEKFRKKKEATTKLKFKYWSLWKFYKLTRSRDFTVRYPTLWFIIMCQMNHRKQPCSSVRVQNPSGMWIMSF